MTNSSILTRYTRNKIYLFYIVNHNVHCISTIHTHMYIYNVLFKIYEREHIIVVEQ